MRELKTVEPDKTAEPAIRLPEETVNYLQRLDYELGGLQVLHTHALRAGADPEKLAAVKREFQETFAEYQIAKAELWTRFAPEHPHFKSWRVDFQTGFLHIVDPAGGEAGHA